MNGELTSSVTEGSQKGEALGWNCHNELLDHLKGGSSDSLLMQHSEFHSTWLPLVSLTTVSTWGSILRTSWVCCSAVHNSITCYFMVNKWKAKRADWDIHLLNNATTINIQRQINNFIFNNACQASSLVLCSKIHQFLDHLKRQLVNDRSFFTFTDIVTKNVLHEFHGIRWDYLFVNSPYLLKASVLQFRLDESRAILIRTELYDVPHDILVRVNNKIQV